MFCFFKIVFTHCLFLCLPHLRPPLQDNANYTGLAARDTAHALKVFTQGIRGVVTSPQTSRPLKEKLLNCAYDVMVKSGELINEAKNAINHPHDPDNKARLAQVRSGVNEFFGYNKELWCYTIFRPSRSKTLLKIKMLFSFHYVLVILRNHIFKGIPGNHHRFMVRFPIGLS